jgi:hypothetical protein
VGIEFSAQLGLQFPVSLGQRLQGEFHAGSLFLTCQSQLEEFAALVPVGVI